MYPMVTFSDTSSSFYDDPALAPLTRVTSSARVGLNGSIYSLPPSSASSSSASAASSGRLQILATTSGSQLYCTPPPPPSCSSRGGNSPSVACNHSNQQICSVNSSGMGNRIQHSTAPPSPHSDKSSPARNHSTAPPSGPSPCCYSLDDNEINERISARLAETATPDVVRFVPGQPHIHLGPVAGHVLPQLPHPQIGQALVYCYHCHQPLVSSQQHHCHVSPLPSQCQDDAALRQSLIDVTQELHNSYPLLLPSPTK